MSQLARRVGVGCVVFSMIASCSGSSDSSGSTTSASVSSSAPSTTPDAVTLPDGPDDSVSPADDAVVDPADAGVVATFASAGITIVDPDGPGALSAGPELTFTAYQAANLARAQRLGAGTTGEQLDRLIPTADDEWPLSYVVTGWLLGAESPAAAAARTLTPTVVAADPATLDPSETLFTSAVLALFVQDLAAHSSEAEGPAGLRSTAAPQGVMAPARSVTPVRFAPIDPCATIMSLYDQSLGKVVALMNDVGGYLEDVFLSFIGLKDPFKGIQVPGKNGPSPLSPAPFRALAFLIGLAGAVSPWTVALASTPGNEPPIAYGVSPGLGNDGVAKVTVDPGLDIEWPPFLKSCASLFGLDLPDLSPTGGVVEWTYIGGDQATKTDEFQVLGAEGDPYSASLTYRTSTEDADTAARGTPITDVAVVSAKVTRPGVSNLATIVQNMISTYITLPILADLVTFFTGDLVGTLEAMTEPSEAILIVHVLHHVPPPPPDATDPPSPPLPPDDPSSSCLDRDLVSVYDQANLPGGVVLHLYPNRDVVFDFNTSQPVFTDASGIRVDVQILGTETGRWTSVTGGFSTSETKVSLSGTITIGGEISPIDPATLAGFASVDEQLSCVDGVVTLQRTGQIFS